MIGMMQGRLLPMIDNKIQSFPGPRWGDEFKILREIGYECIELTIDYDDWVSHPLIEESNALVDASGSSGIKVIGVCCDIFMQRNFFEYNEPDSIKILKKIINSCGQKKVGMIEIPLLGRNSLKNESEGLCIEKIRIFNRIIKSVTNDLKENRVVLAIEADLAPSDLLRVLSEYDANFVGINYDMGNSTYFGFDPIEEINSYFHLIKNIHIKDCKRGEYTVPLGSGETKFNNIFELLREKKYTSNYVIQAARQIDDVKAAVDYLSFVKKYISLGEEN